MATTAQRTLPLHLRFHFIHTHAIASHTSADASSLWKEFFKDFSQWSVDSDSKTEPHFQCKFSGRPFRMPNTYNLPWIDEELWRRGSVSILTAELSCGETERLKGTFNRIKQMEEVLYDTGNSEFQDVSDYMALLKDCGNQKDLEKTTRIHEHILRRGLLGKDLSLGNMLVSAYAKCGELSNAWEVFDQLFTRDVVSWNAVITGYVQNGQHEDALMCFEHMKHEGVSASSVTYICALKACGSIGAIKRGEKIHAETMRLGFLERCVSVGNALVDMYAKCGVVEKAREVFDDIQVHNIISWNALLTGYVNHGHSEVVLNCHERMQREGFSPNKVTFLCILKACGNIGAANKGREAHAEVVRRNLLGKDALIGTALVDMYGKCGTPLHAQEVFDQLPHCDLVSWNALISGYASHGHDKEALHCFERMQQEGLSPDNVTFVCVLKACANIGALDIGKEIHADIIREKLQKNVLVGTALVDMYAKCGAILQAREIFDQLQSHNEVSWNSLITGYANQGHGNEALNCFEQMRREGFSADAVTYLSLLKACATIGALDMGKDMHSEIMKEGLLQKEILIGNALVDMYAKCGALGKAREVFDGLNLQTVVSWNVLIAGYAQQGFSEEALNCFQQMQDKGYSPNIVTFTLILKACGNIGTIDKGLEIHVDIMKAKLCKDVLIGNALVDMYAKCGVLTKAQELFDNLAIRDVVCWTALIAGYAQRGQDEIVIDLFNKMIEEGIKPDLVTCTIVLNACSHSGLLEKGEMYFEAMNTSYDVIPSLDHCTCMIDMFGRAGRFEKVISVLEKLPTTDYLPAWTTLLGACHKWGNVELGRVAFDHVIRLDEKHCSAYVCMSNIYVAAAMHEEAEKIETMRMKNKAWENPDCCLRIDVNGNDHNSEIVGNSGG